MHVGRFGTLAMTHEMHGEALCLMFVVSKCKLKAICVATTFSCQYMPKPHI
jgi:hypothetical protein